jgi:thioredoxin reductase (NADPH)
MEEALVLTKYSPKVFVIHRRNELRASAAMQRRVFANGKISFIWDSEVSEILGETKVDSLLLKTKSDTTQGKALKENNAEITGEIKEEKEGYIFWKFPIQGIFIAIGHSPATEIFKDKVDTDEKGHIVARNRTQTSIPEGVFVAGDVEDHHYKQAITASGLGCMAGMDVLRYLDKETPNW